MCASGDLMEKTLTEAAQLLQKISKAAAMRRDWETRLAEEPEYNSRKKKCAEFSKEATPEVTKEEPITEKVEQEHIKSRTTPSIDFAVPNETIKRSMSSAKPLREFEPMDWVPIEKYSTREYRSLIKTYHPRNVEVHEIREMCFQEQRTRDDPESRICEASKSRTREDPKP
jgi:hypothetical protein